MVQVRASCRAGSWQEGADTQQCLGLVLTPFYTVHQTKPALRISEKNMMALDKSQGCALTVEVSFIQDLRLDDLLYDVLQCDNAHHLIEGVPFSLIIHPLDNGQVRLS